MVFIFGILPNDEKKRCFYEYCYFLQICKFIEKAEVDTFIENSKINKVIAQKDVIFSNSLIEAVNKRIKYDFLFPAELQNFEQTVKQLEKAITEYNDKPYLPLHDLTPSEVFEGKIPDKNMFSNEIAEAKVQRIIENRRFRCINHKSLKTSDFTVPLFQFVKINLLFSYMIIQILNFVQKKTLKKASRYWDGVF